jgi:hypothetical protein
MLKVMSDVLILKDIKMFQNDSNKKYIIELEYKDIDNELIKHSFEYHHYDNAINDMLMLTKSIKGGEII